MRHVPGTECLSMNSITNNTLFIKDYLVHKCKVSGALFELSEGHLIILGAETDSNNKSKGTFDKSVASTTEELHCLFLNRNLT